ncbi:MAG: SpoIIE family protein phosphatase [Candidatus Omnitrophota bacterium]
MIRINIPFQFKIYLLIIVLFILMVNFTTTRVNSIVTHRIMEEDESRFKDLKTVFFNLLNTKIETIRNEALLQSEQKHIRQSLSMLSEGRLVESFLVSSFPRSDQRDLIILTDAQGKVIDGKIVLSGRKSGDILRNPIKIQECLQTFYGIQSALQGVPKTDYLFVEKEFPFSLFAVASVPVVDPDRKDKAFGAVCIGFPVDENLAWDLRSGSRFHIGFVLHNRLITTTLDSQRAIDFRNFWDNMAQKEKNSLLNQTKVLTLFRNRYLVYASPLPHAKGNEGLYIILSPLEEKYQFLNQLRTSIYTVSLYILFVTLLLGFFLARGVTAPIKSLAGTVSRIAEGDYSVDASIRTGDELEFLGGEINRLTRTLKERADEINKYVAEIKEWNKGLENKVAKRTQDLEEKNFRLRLISEELSRAYSQIDDELKTVGELQKNLLPKPTLDLDGVSIRCFYMPNGRTGGDYYDFFPLGRQEMYVLIADVSGHGAPAAFIMGITRSIAHTLIKRKSSPGDVLTSLSNTLVGAIRSGEFVTMFLGRLDLDAQVLTYSAAGHPPPVLYSKQDGTLTDIEVNRGLPLGILENHQYDELSLQLQPGDRLLLYTDGIIEACDAKREPFGEERLRAVMRKCEHSSPKDLLDMIMLELEQYVQHPLDVDPLDDDVTLVALDFKAFSLPPMKEWDENLNS